MELHHLSGEVLDGADLVEQLPQPMLDEPAERIALELDSPGWQDSGIAEAFRSGRAPLRASSMCGGHGALLAGMTRTGDTEHAERGAGATADRIRDKGATSQNGNGTAAAYTDNGRGSGERGIVPHIRADDHLLDGSID